MRWGTDTHTDRQPWPRYISLGCAWLVPHSTTYEELGCVWPVVSVSHFWPVVSVSHFTNPMVGPHLQWTGPPSYWPAAAHWYYLLQSSQVFWPHSLCWSIHGSQLSPEGQSGPSAKKLELSFRPTASYMAQDGGVWPCTTQHWSGNRLSTSPEPSGMEYSHGNGYVRLRTSHTMMMMMMMCLMPYVIK